MHELALLTGVVARVEDVALAKQADRVEAVYLRVGSLSGALPEALEGAWPLATAQSRLPEARLVIEMVTAAVWCPTCEANQAIDEFFALTCPVCATPTGQLVAGREFELVAVDLE